MVACESLTDPTLSLAGGARFVVEVWLPYGRSEIPVRVPEERLLDILRPDSAAPVVDPVGEAKRLLAANESFSRKASEAASVCIVLGFCGSPQLTSDLTRTALESIGGVQTAVTVLCTDESFDPDVQSVASSRILRHIAKSETVDCTPEAERFTPQVNADFAKADLKVLIGELKPHQLLKYAGLCDLVFPGLASATSSLAQLTDRTGITLDSIHTERIQAAKRFDNLFALGFTLNGELRPTKLVFDDLESCLRALEPTVDKEFSKSITKRADVVVVGSGGTPFDSTLASAVEAVPAGLNALKKEGVLILAAECGGGHGGGSFYQWSADVKEARFLESRLKNRFNYGGSKASFLRRSLQSHRIYLVSTIPDHYVEHTFGMKPAATVNGALQSAQRALGADSTISVIPNGSRVIALQPEAQAGQE